MKVVCAIHQPNFFPWLGYFEKIKKADIFVFLDDVQIQKTGSSWVNRTKLNAFGKRNGSPAQLPVHPVLLKLIKSYFLIKNGKLIFLKF